MTDYLFPDTFFKIFEFVGFTDEFLLAVGWLLPLTDTGNRIRHI